MALSEELQVFRDTYDLLLRVCDLQPKLPRLYRYTVGERLVNQVLDTLSLIYEVNSGQDKQSALSRLQRSHQMTVLLLRLLSDRRVLTPQQFAPYVQLETRIGRQITGWKNYYAARK